MERGLLANPGICYSINCGDNVVVSLLSKLMPQSVTERYFDQLWNMSYVTAHPAYNLTCSLKPKATKLELWNKRFAIQGSLDSLKCWNRVFSGRGL